MLWNDYYRFLPDGEHDFADVQHLIWKTLVQKALQDIFEDVSDGEIIVTPKHESTSALVGIELTAERIVSWQDTKICIDGAPLLFEDFFDFRNSKDPRELQYVECWNTTPLKEHLLVPTSEVNFYYRERKQI